MSHRARTALFRSPAFLGHDTGRHVEIPARIAAIERELARRDLLSGRPDLPFTPASDLAITLVHSARYLTALERFVAAGGGWIDQDTVAREDSLDVARLAAGATVRAVGAIVSGEIDRGFVIARPPGHHATAERAMGFCLLNTVAIGAASALATGLERVAILDWDVHHGNGTQDLFYGRGDVLYCSVHQSPLFPYTGRAGETGTGEGQGFTLNRPLPTGSGDEAFLAAIADLIERIDRFEPELILVSAGYDASERDPIGGLEVTESGFRQAMQHVVTLAERCCDGQVLAVLEGGYDPPTLGRCVADSIAILDGETPSTE